MTIVYPNLQRKMMEHNISVENLADLLNLPVEKIKSRLAGESEWTLFEAGLACRYLGESDVKLLFLRLDYKS